MRSGRIQKTEGRLGAVLGSSYWRVDDARVVVEAWKASGLSQSAFARRHGFHVRRLMRWRRRLEARDSRPDVASLVPVRAIGSPDDRYPADVVDDPTMEVVIDDCLVVRLGPGFEAEALRRLLDVLAC